jgi:hypothetical protein
VILSVTLALLVFVTPTSAALRFQERSLYIGDSQPSAVTDYTISWRYMSPDAIGSVDILFCQDPIPYHDCITPAGFSATSATLTNQTGEVGFAISSKSANHIVLSRQSTAITSPLSSYTFSGVVNPSDESQAFAVRLRSHASTNATGPQIDFGSVRGQVANGVVIETQVPPMLIFCLAQEVAQNCVNTNDTYYTNMGTLEPTTTLVAESQMAVGTNASGGFAITANGSPPSAGTTAITPLQTPTVNTPGTNQFGINLVANNEPAIGDDPEGEWANALPSPEYSLPNRYKYVPGDVIAFSPNVSLMKKFTVSYILNAQPSLKAGVYTTTITFIASGRF